MLVLLLFLFFLSKMSARVGRPLCASDIGSPSQESVASVAAMQIRVGSM